MLHVPIVHVKNTITACVVNHDKIYTAVTSDKVDNTRQFHLFLRHTGTTVLFTLQCIASFVMINLLWCILEQGIYMYTTCTIMSLPTER